MTAAAGTVPTPPRISIPRPIDPRPAALLYCLSAPAFDRIPGWIRPHPAPLAPHRTKRSMFMRFALNTPNFGIYFDPRLLAELAHDAEAAGWDGFFLWDHIGAAWEVPIADPWIQMAAMAMTTERIKLGAL